MMSDLRFAMICASNVNRSVAAHALLKEHGFDVRILDALPTIIKP